MILYLFILQLHLKAFPSDSLPALHIIKVQNKHNDADTSTATIILHCPDSSHVRSKMLHSSCLSSLPGIFTAQNIEIAIEKTKIIQSFEDFDDDDNEFMGLLIQKTKSMEIASNEDESLGMEEPVLSKPSFTKPKRAGRKGSSRLI